MEPDNGISPSNRWTHRTKNQWLEQYLRLVVGNNKEWSNLLALATLVHNNSVNSTTGLVPNQLLIRREPPATPVQGEGSDNPLAEQRVRQLGERRIMVTQALNRAAQKQPAPTPRFVKGQKVWLDAKNLMLPYGTIKLVPKRHGPFEIKEVRSPVVYQLTLPPQWRIHPVFHASLLTPYIETDEHGPNYTRPLPDMIEGKEQYKVEAIRAHRYRGHKIQYLIKWKGYPESDNTWEPEGKLHTPRLVKEYHEAHSREDKRAKQKARMTSASLPHSSPVWLLDNNPQNTFDSAEVAATALAAVATANSSTAGLSTPEQPPQKSLVSLRSLLRTSSTTLPSIPHINSSNSACLHYPVFVPQFAAAASYSPALLSATSHTPTHSSTHIFAEILAARLTIPTKCLPCLAPPRRKIHADLHHTRQMSPRPPNKPPSRKLRRLLSLPPSHSPLPLASKKQQRRKKSPTSSSSSERSTPQSLQEWLRPSSLSTHSSPLTVTTHYFIKAVRRTRGLSWR